MVLTTVVYTNIKSTSDLNNVHFQILSWHDTDLNHTTSLEPADLRCLLEQTCYCPLQLYFQLQHGMSLAFWIPNPWFNSTNAHQAKPQQSILNLCEVNNTWFKSSQACGLEKFTCCDHSSHNGSGTAIELHI